jgi:membrane protein implicated in regulation of membrane protease activity
MEKKILWLILGIVFFIVEIFTPGMFFSMCLGLSAILTFLLSFLVHEIYAQIIFFILMSVVLIFVVFRVAHKISPSKQRVGLDSIIGKIVTIEDKFDAGTYRVKVNGEVWHAVSSDSTQNAFSIGEKAIIVRIEGTKLVLKKYTPTADNEQK